MPEEEQDNDTKIRLRCGEAADMIGVSVSQMRIMDKNGILIPEFTLPASKQRIYSLRQVEDFITKMKKESQVQKTTPPTPAAPPQKKPSARIAAPALVETPAAPTPIVRPLNPLTGETKDPELHAYVIDFIPLHGIIGSKTETATWKGGKWPWRYSKRTLEMHGVTDFSNEEKVAIIQDRIFGLVSKYEKEKGIIVGQEPVKEPTEEEKFWEPGQ